VYGERPRGKRNRRRCKHVAEAVKKKKKNKKKRKKKTKKEKKEKDKKKLPLGHLYELRPRKSEHVPAKKGKGKETRKGL